MLLDRQLCYRAVRSRDARFDGRFFTAVRTTRIYCRPICPARTPHLKNIDFYPHAAGAEEAGFRPCRRCRPDTAPGAPDWNGAPATVSRALRLINDGALDGGTVPALALRLGLGERQLDRLFKGSLGATPSAVARTRRAHFARKLIQETSLSMTEVAYSAGYSSVRRFNDALRQHFRCTPSELRSGRLPAGADHLTLELTYRPPLDLAGLLPFLARRCIPGIESCAGGIYRRGVRFEDRSGVVAVEPMAGKPAFRLRVPAVLSPDLLVITERIRRIFDLRADPAGIDAHLAENGLRHLVKVTPGVRVPGCWDGFELAVRAILGQQVSVKGATTLAGRLVRQYGETALGGSAPPPRGEKREGSGGAPATTPRNGKRGKQGAESAVDAPLDRVFPVAERLARARLEKIGLPGGRAAAIRGLARAVARGDLSLAPHACPDEVRQKMMAIPGIGPWTAEYVVMRAQQHPDAFPDSDLGLAEALKNAPGFDGRRPSPARVRAVAEAWRPWRSYAALSLWRSLSS